MRSRFTFRATIALASVFVGGVASAATLQWQTGAGTNDMAGPNYTDTVSTNLSPGTGNALYIGAAGTATYSVSSGSLSVSLLRIGHNLAGALGTGTVIINDGTIVTTAGNTGANAGVIIDAGSNNGTLIMNGGTLISNRLINVGYENNATRRAFLSVGTTAYIATQVGNLSIGDGSTSGVRGDVVMNGRGTFSGDLVTGAARGSTYTQNAGSVTVVGTTYVGRDTASGSTFTMNGGTLTTAAFTQSEQNAGAANTTTTITGSAWIETTPVVTTGHNFTIGAGTNSIGTVFNISGSATVKSGNRFLIGASGVANALANNIIVNQDSGTLTTAVDLRLGDAGGYATYNLSGGTILNSAGILVSRRGTGRFVQTGGTANASGSGTSAGLRIGDSETRDAGTGIGTILTNNGIYTISGGTLNATSLAVGNNGSGTFEVVGSGGVINVAGALSTRSVIGTPPNSSTGALKFTLDPNELLSEIMVGGVASLGNGTYIQIDDLGTPPTPGSAYQLLTATSIVDNGTTYTLPSADWYHEVIPGGNGQELRAYYLPEPGSAVLLVGLALALTRRRKRRCG